MTQEKNEGSDLDLGFCEEIRAESTGQPGHRYFRVLVKAEHGSVMLWLEKEDLFELAMAIKRLVEKEPGPIPGVTGFDYESGARDYEFKVTSLAIGFEEATGNYLLVAGVGTIDSTGETIPFASEVFLRMDHQLLDHFADEALFVCASGRPRCPLCGAALNEDETHVCPRANGHRRQ